MNCFYKYSIFFRSDGNLNSAVLRHKKYDDDIITELKKDTSFLPDSATIQERLYCIKNNIKSIKKCPACSSQIEFKYNEYKTFCSTKCSAISNINNAYTTKKQKYGNGNFNNRSLAKKTCKERYGVENIFEDTERMRQAYINSLGVSNPSFDNKIAKNRGKVISESRRSNGDGILWDKELLEKEYIQNKKSITQISQEYKVSDSWLGSKIKTYFQIDKRYNYKGFEKTVMSFIQENYSGTILTNDRSIISPQELDIYIPKLNLAIECNGSYWHSSKYRHKNYHLEKTIDCESKGVVLLHVFDFDWYDKTDVWKSMLLNKLNCIEMKIFARKCQIMEHEKNDPVVKKFLDENHLYGSLGYQIALSLIDESSNIVAMMTFSSSRWNKNADMELTRFCSLKNCRVVGGASKLFSYFLKLYPNKKIVTYADRSYSNGNLYEKLGFTWLYDTKPNYRYLVNGKLESRYKFQKKKLTQKLSRYNPELSERQNMIDSGYERVYDSGNKVYLFK